MFTNAKLRINLSILAIVFSVLPVKISANSQKKVSSGSITLHGLFQDHAVLQKGQQVPIWGKGTDGETVTVTFNGQNVSTTVTDGKWKVVLNPMDYGGPYNLIVQGSNTIKLSDIYVGEVWICSGQSNMEYSLPANEAPAAANPLVRTFKIPRADGYIPSPRSDIESNSVWRVSTPTTTAGYFSAVGYYFARKLSETLNVAVGIIHASYGGTYIEAWTSLSMQKAVPELQPVLSYWNGKNSNDPWYPANLYNGMIHPIAPYAIKGFCWYQGESLVSNGALYRDQLPALVQDWRNLWKAGDLPFYIVQLPNYGALQTDPDKSIGGWKAVQEAQLLAMRHMKNVGLAVTIDVGDMNDIHPKNKRDVGTRLALSALAKTYQKNLTYSGPIYNSMTIESNSIRLKFDNAENMVAKDGGKLTGFAICGSDNNLVWGNATIDGNTIIVNSPSVSAPTCVRYAWHSYTPIFNLFNTDGLPASPFRTDCPTGIINNLPTEAPSIDVTPPTVPTNLAGKAASQTAINLTWTKSDDAVGVTSYRIYRNGAEIGTSTTTSYADKGLTASTKYTYSVAAYDAAGNASAQCTAVNVTTKTEVPTNTPTISDNDENQKESNLSQNYPNPFNATTSIQYLVVNTEYIVLRIFDIHGREVTTLVNEQKNAGTYTVEWDSTDYAGQQVGSGMYFYQLKTGKGEVETKTMMFSK